MFGRIFVLFLCACVGVFFVRRLAFVNVCVGVVCAFVFVFLCLMCVNVVCAYAFVFVCLCVCLFVCMLVCVCVGVCYVSVCINFVFGVDLNSTQLGWRLIDTGVSGQPNA